MHAQQKAILWKIYYDKIFLFEDHNLLKPASRRKQEENGVRM